MSVGSAFPQNACFRNLEDIYLHIMLLLEQQGGAMQSAIRVFLFCFMISTLSACATVTIEGDVPKTAGPECQSNRDTIEDDASRPAGSLCGTDTVHGSYYNFVWSRPPVTRCEDGRGLARIRTHTNAAYSLAAILTLGLYVPQTISWWCDGTREDGPGEEAWEPAGNQ